MAARFDGPPVVVGFLLFLGGTAVTWIASRLLRAIRASGDVSLGEFIVKQSREQFVRSIASSRNAVKIIAPTGFSEIQIGFGSLERLMAPGALVRSYLLGLVLTPVIFALFLTALMNSGPELQRRVVGIYFGYNALAVVSCLTAGLILTLFAMLVLTYSRTLLLRIDVKAALRSIATWTGYGTAAGVVTAALLPTMTHLMPNTLDSMPGAEMGLSPQLLIDVPASFAVIGYALGIAIGVTVVGRHASNLLLRHFAAPTVLICALLGMTYIGVNPSNMVRSMVSATPVVDFKNCTDEAFREHLDNSAWILKAIDTCGGGVAYVQTQPFLLSIGAVLGVLAFVALIRDFRRGARAMAETSNVDLGSPARD
jgi:hypothetical protein